MLIKLNFCPMFLPLGIDGQIEIICGSRRICTEISLTKINKILFQVTVDVVAVVAVDVDADVEVRRTRNGSPSQSWAVS